MEADVTSGRKISVPIAAVIALACTLGGSYFKDRIETMSGTAALTARVDETTRRLDELRGAQKQYVTRDEYGTFSSALERRLDELRADLKEIKELARRR